MKAVNVQLAATWGANHELCHGNWKIAQTGGLLVAVTTDRINHELCHYTYDVTLQAFNMPATTADPTTTMQPTTTNTAFENMQDQLKVLEDALVCNQ
jgi:hypothetical protein